MAARWGTAVPPPQYSQQYPQQQQQQQHRPPPQSYAPVPPIPQHYSHHRPRHVHHAAAGSAYGVNQYLESDSNDDDDYVPVTANGKGIGGQEEEKEKEPEAGVVQSLWQKLVGGSSGAAKKEDAKDDGKKAGGNGKEKGDGKKRPGIAHARPHVYSREGGGGGQYASAPPPGYHPSSLGRRPSERGNEAMTHERMRHRSRSRSRPQSVHRELVPFAPPGLSKEEKAAAAAKEKKAREAVEAPPKAAEVPKDAQVIFAVPRGVTPPPPPPDPPAASGLLSLLPSWLPLPFGPSPADVAASTALTLHRRPRTPPADPDHPPLSGEPLAAMLAYLALYTTHGARPGHNTRKLQREAGRVFRRMSRGGFRVLYKYLVHVKRFPPVGDVGPPVDRAMLAAMVRGNNTSNGRTIGERELRGVEDKLKEVLVKLAGAVEGGGGGWVPPGAWVDDDDD